MGSADGVAGKCDPGRGFNPAWRPFGAWMGVNPGVFAYQLQANVENDAIPYVEAGSKTYAHVELRNTAVPPQPDGGARIFIALSWSSVQGKLESTGVRVYLEDEEGDQVNFDRTWRLGDIVWPATNPRLDIALLADSSEGWEDYQATVQGIFPLLGPEFEVHGAEWFNESRVFVATNNDSSQVPGGTADPENFATIRARSNYGWHDFGNPHKLQGAGWGNSSYGTGFVFAWDTACVSP